jgi:Protein of unknown function (DUF2505)
VQFTIEQRLVGSPQDVEAVLLDPAFVTARATLPKLSDPELLECTRESEHAHQRIRFRFTEQLSGAVTAVVDPERLTWVDDATYDLAAHVAEHRIEPDHYPDRLASSYRATLAADGEGSRRVLAGTVKVRMPLVGGRVERVIVSGLTEYAAAEAALINEWLSRG